MESAVYTDKHGNGEKVTREAGFRRLNSPIEVTPYDRRKAAIAADNFREKSFKGDIRLQLAIDAYRKSEYGVAEVYLEQALEADPSDERYIEAYTGVKSMIGYRVRHRGVSTRHGPDSDPRRGETHVLTLPKTHNYTRVKPNITRVIFHLAIYLAIYIYVSHFMVVWTEPSEHRVIPY